MIVIDASTAVKWFIAETGSDQAERILLDHLGDISVPDLFVVEVNAALVRMANIDKTQGGRVNAHIAAFAAMAAAGDFHPIRLKTDTLAHANELAVQLGHPLKDCIYLAQSINLDCPLITADTRFAAKARDTYGQVRVLGE